MYRNFIFDLYGTLVDIHTNEYKPSLWKKMALFYSFQGAAYTGKELRCRYRQLETAAVRLPLPTLTRKSAQQTSSGSCTPKKGSNPQNLF